MQFISITVETPHYFKAVINAVTLSHNDDKLGAFELHTPLSPCSALHCLHYLYVWLQASSPLLRLLLSL